VTIPPGSALADLLAQELGLLHSFVTLMRHEQSLLVDGKADVLAEIAEEKSGLAGQLARRAMAREEELGRRGYAAGRMGMDDWIKSAEGTTSRRRWQQLLELATEARALNETNGKLIAVQLQHNQQALNTLLAAVDQAATYGPDGQQRAGASGRSLGSA
jgi:flagella synthesis protein FlgN